MISHVLYDAWKVCPPCMNVQGECHCECPYFSDCFGEFDDVDDVDDV